MDKLIFDIVPRYDGKLNIWVCKLNSKWILAHVAKSKREAKRWIEKAQSSRPN